MDTPKTIADLQRLIDNGVQENVHLDYKSSAMFTQNANAVRADLGKDVSAFANSDGGILIVGIVEDKKTKLPHQLDGGVANAEWSRERIEDVLSTAVAPPIHGVEILPIPASHDRSYFAIVVPKSYRGPHQEVVEHRYYKRANFKCSPMEDYELRDVWSRREFSPALISVDVNVRRGVILELVVSNVGDVAAEDVHFTVTPPLENLAKAKLLTDGARFFQPGKTLHFFLGSAIQEVRRENALKFDVAVRYRNPRRNDLVTETFHFDLSDLSFSSIVETDTAELTKALKETMEKLTRELSYLRAGVDRMTTLAGATGLDVSVSTLRNLKRIAAGGDVDVPRLPARGCAWTVFAEVLDVDEATARLLETHAHWSEGQRLEDVDGLTSDVIGRARAAFRFDDELLSD